MLVSSIFSFSLNVFKSLPCQGCQKSGLCGEGFNRFVTQGHLKSGICGVDLNFLELKRQAIYQDLPIFSVPKMMD